MNKKISCNKFKKMIFIVYIIIGVIIFFIGSDWHMFIAILLKMGIAFALFFFLFCKNKNLSL